MHIGVVFPQTEIGNNPNDIRNYAEAVEAAGYSHLVVYDHVLGANPDRPGGWLGPYTYRSAFHEVFVLLSFAAAITAKLQLTTGIVILPQRQTALVAKQAASLDVVSGGRLRLGVGLGWNPVEYEALGQKFSNRGRRIEEQIDLMRKLWTEELVTFEGQWHNVTDAGLNPLPVQRPIPIWMGGNAEVAMRRIARVADGWILNTPLGEQLANQLEQIRLMISEAGRDPNTFGLEGRVHWKGDLAQVVSDLDEWKAHGVSHVSITTMSAGLTAPQDHIKVLEQIASKLK